MDKYEICDVVYCIKEYNGFKLYSNYVINACGDLTMIPYSGKVGYGFLVENDPYINGHISDYFTVAEMDKYFMLGADYYKMRERTNKIEKLLKK